VTSSSFIGEYWSQKANAGSDNKGKELRREGFTLAEERYGAFSPAILVVFFLTVVDLWTVFYKPILEEVEKILAEAGLDEDEMRKGAAGASASGPGGVAGLSRNRR
jgi:hypothetical protein